MKNSITATLTSLSVIALTSIAHAAHHEEAMVSADDQGVANGMIKVNSAKSMASGWLVVHRTDAAMKPGAVIGHAPVMKGDNSDVSVSLDEAVSSGDKLMVMLHQDNGGKVGEFEYTLGSSTDGPVKQGGMLVMDVITIE